MKVIEDNENSLLNRREMKVIIDAAKNPSTEDACKMLAEEFKAVEELIAIRGVKGKFGRNTFLISANIYNKKEDKDALEKKKEKKTAPGSK